MINLELDVVIVDKVNLMQPTPIAGAIDPFAMMTLMSWSSGLILSKSCSSKQHDRTAQVSIIIALGRHVCCCCCLLPAAARQCARSSVSPSLPLIIMLTTLVLTVMLSSGWTALLLMLTVSLLSSQLFHAVVRITKSFFKLRPGNADSMTMIIVSSGTVDATS
ncbi:unnamed protein product [Vitrella brassicaformis CCMP3155]|uniref:Uncharacterized protein n=1 Tax=Vitrella brassicaformis (strain CCMP3155) TaxID=1169540 RepID=A0A0G4GS95_VITBC|nr:unnamed protein product [Vitrella brassicaformis CCMP3155]|eukprot:CEM33489.1 unnamed protein product [Vitrella brassicaformis CCMP3155]